MIIGDSIKVKNGVLDNEFEKYDISGWQGRIIEIDPTDGVFLINLMTRNANNIGELFFFELSRPLGCGRDYIKNGFSQNSIKKFRLKTFVCFFLTFLNPS